MSFLQQHLLVIFNFKHEWQQVSSSLQDSFKYSGGCQQCCNQDVSIHLFIYNSSNTISKPLETIPIESIWSGIIITITIIFYSFLCSLARSKYLSLFTFSLIFILWSAEIAKFTIWQILCLLLIITRSSLLAQIRWSVCISKYQRIVCIAFSRMDSGLSIYHLVVWSNFNLLHNSQ